MSVGGVLLRQRLGGRINWHCRSSPPDRLRPT